MTDTSDPSRFRLPSRLRNGTAITIRVARPGDRERIVAAFDKLDAQSVYTRFFGYRKQLSETLFDRLDAVDFDRFVALLATIGSDADETVIGAGSYVVLDPAAAARSADIAFLVEEDYQGQGLAGQLFATLADIARGRGIARFEADVLAGNTGMLKVFRHSGLPMTTARETGSIHFALDLAPGAPQP